jgi:tRNA-intron endonuclease, archaea type
MKAKIKKSKAAKQEPKAETAEVLKPTEDAAQKESPAKEKVKAYFHDDRVISEDSDSARELFNQSRYGIVLENKKVQFSLYEALYLMEKGKVLIHDSKNTEMAFESFLKKAKKLEPSFWVKYCVFKDIRGRGYIIKTALKFGADFRVYDRGIKPGEDHARWIVYPVHEGSVLTWYEFAAKNRVAHSTKKRLLIGIVDEENSVTYYEIKWMRP